jgi:lipopolysaccharide biosynthesis glycosyltransferase
VERTNRPVVLACDEAYAMPLATTLRSIVDSNSSGHRISFYVLTTGMSDGARKRVLNSLPAGTASIQWLHVGLDAFAEYQTRSHISKMTYARLLIPEMFPDADRALYLDSDILVLRDLTPLWETDLEGNLLGAVLDGMDPQLKSGDQTLQVVPHVRSYFNAGVLLMDLNKWREERISERALEYLGQFPNSPFSDQDALNVVCDGRWKRVDGRWNCQAHLNYNDLSKMRAEQVPAIVHFVTSGKPWNMWVPNANAAVYDVFRSRTLFARTVSQKVWDQLLRLGCLLKEASKRRSGGRVFYNALKRLWHSNSFAR